MASTFFNGIWQQVQQSLTDSVDAIGLSRLDSSEILVHVAGQLVLSALLLTGVLLIYLGFTWLTALLAMRLRVTAFGAHHLTIAVRYLFLLFAALVIMAQYSAPPDLLEASSRAGLLALAVYLVWLGAARALREVISRSHLDLSLAQLLKNTLSVVFVVFGSVSVLSQFGFDVISIVAGLGIVGIAVGFAAQSTLSNFIAGVTLLVERPFRIGDWVKISDQEGKVVKIALRTTWLRTRDNIFAMIPNDKVASSHIINYTAEGPIRIRLSLGIAYKESAAAARAVILPILEAHPQVILGDDMAPRVDVAGLGSSSIDLTALVWIPSSHIDFQPLISSQLLESIKAGLDAAGIEIPFPHLQLFIDNAKGLQPLVAPFYPPAAGPPSQPANGND